MRKLFVVVLALTVVNACSGADNDEIDVAATQDMVSGETNVDEADLVASEDVASEREDTPDLEAEPDVEPEPEVAEDLVVPDVVAEADLTEGDDTADEDVAPVECPNLDFGTGQHVAWLEVGKGGHPWHALDVDGDPTTCAPTDDCEQGLDNQLSDAVHQLVPLLPIPDPINDAIEDGQLVLLFDFEQLPADGSPFTLNFFTGTPVASKEECNWQMENCQFEADPELLDPQSCSWLASFDNAELVGDLLLAGGPDHTFYLSLPIANGVPITLTLHRASLKAEVLQGDEGFTLPQGVLGGALVKQELVDEILAIPESLLEVLEPMTPQTLAGLIETMLIPDMDIDGDGELDAVSFGLRFKTNQATLVGIGL